MSSSEYITRFAAGDCPFIALPVTASRVFRHGFIAVDRRVVKKPKDLEGKRIGIVSNNSWQAHRMLPQLKTMLEQDFPGIEVLPIETFPQSVALIGLEETSALVKQSGVDAVIVGNAA